MIACRSPALPRARKAPPRARRARSRPRSCLVSAGARASRRAEPPPDARLLPPATRDCRRPARKRGFGPVWDGRPMRPPPAPPAVTRTAAADIHGRVRGARCRRNSRRPDCRVTAARQRRARSQHGSAVYRIASPLRIRLAPRVATATGGRVGGVSKEAGEAGALRHALGGDSSVSEYPLRRNAPCGARAASTRVRGNSAT